MCCHPERREGSLGHIYPQEFPRGARDDNTVGRHRRNPEQIDEPVSQVLLDLTALAEIDHEESLWFLIG